MSGPAMIVLASLLGVWSLLRPAVESSLEATQRVEMRVHLAALLRTPERPARAIPPIDPGWHTWLHRQVAPPFRLTMLSPEGAVLADSEGRGETGPSGEAALVGGSGSRTAVSSSS
jgi:hypothetical protein